MTTELFPVFLTLLIGASGGALFYLFGVPAAWLSGAMVFVAVAALVRVPVDLPDRLRNGFFVVLGLSMGSAVRPDVVERIIHWPISMALLAVAVFLITAGTYVYLARLIRWDRESAYFGSIPGALSVVMAIASERSADLSRIATSQTVRLLILVCVLPMVVTSTAAHGSADNAAPVLPTAVQAAALVALCLGASLLAARLRIPGGWLTGAFFMSSALNATGTIPVALPQWALVPCYIGLGCFIGSRFRATTLGLFLSMLKASLGAIVVGLAISAAVAWVASEILAMPFGQLLLAYAPGGLEVMTLLAFMLNLDPAFVVAHQLARYIGMVLLLPFVTGLVLGQSQVGPKR